MYNLFKKLLRDESGQGLPEYGMILGAVVVVAIAVAATFGDDVKELFSAISDKTALPE